MKKRQREVRLMRAGIQLAFFIAAPSLFYGQEIIPGTG